MMAQRGLSMAHTTIMRCVQPRLTRRQFSWFDASDSRIAKGLAALLARISY